MTTTTGTLARDLPVRSGTTRSITGSGVVASSKSTRHAPSLQHFWIDAFFSLISLDLESIARSARHLSAGISPGPAVNMSLRTLCSSLASAVRAGSNTVKQKNSSSCSPITTTSFFSSWGAEIRASVTDAMLP
jgi:hypothetical protein